MTKIKKNILFALLAGVLTFGFAACDSCSGGDDGDSSSSSSGPEVTDGVDNTVMLNSFEDFAKDFRLINVGDGGIRIQRTTEYTMDGDYGAKITVGGEYEDSDVSFTLPLQSELYDFHYDLSEYGALKFYVYSDYFDNVTMNIGVRTKDNISACFQEVVLEPGWNDVSYEIVHMEIAMANNDKFDDLKAFYFKFDPILTDDLTWAPILYMDSVRLEVLEEEADIDFDIEKVNLSAGENMLIMGKPDPTAPYFAVAEGSNAEIRNDQYGSLALHNNNTKGDMVMSLDLSPVTLEQLKEKADYLELDVIFGINSQASMNKGATQVLMGNKGYKNIYCYQTTQQEYYDKLTFWQGYKVRIATDEFDGNLYFTTTIKEVAHEYTVGIQSITIGRGVIDAGDLATNINVGAKYTLPEAKVMVGGSAVEGEVNVTATFDDKNVDVSNLKFDKQGTLTLIYTYGESKAWRTVNVIRPDATVNVGMMSASNIYATSDTAATLGDDGYGNYALTNAFAHGTMKTWLDLGLTAAELRANYDYLEFTVFFTGSTPVLVGDGHTYDTIKFWSYATGQEVEQFDGIGKYKFSIATANMLESVMYFTSAPFGADGYDYSIAFLDVIGGKGDPVGGSGIELPPAEKEPVYTELRGEMTASNCYVSAEGGEYIDYPMGWMTMGYSIKNVSGHSEIAYKIDLGISLEEVKSTYSYLEFEIGWVADNGQGMIGNKVNGSITNSYLWNHTDGVCAVLGNWDNSIVRIDTENFDGYLYLLDFNSWDSDGSPYQFMVSFQKVSGIKYVEHVCAYEKEVIDDMYLVSEAKDGEAAVYYYSCRCGRFDPEGETFEYNVYVGSLSTYPEFVATNTAIILPDVTLTKNGLPVEESEITKTAKFNDSSVNLSDYLNGSATEGTLEVTYTYETQSYTIVIQILAPTDQMHTVKKATSDIVVDGKIDAAWNAAEQLDVINGKTEGTAYGYVKVLWTEEGLYLLAVVTDSTIKQTADTVNFWVAENATSVSQGYDLTKGYIAACIYANGTESDYADGKLLEVNGVECAGKTFKALGYYVVEMFIPRLSEGSYAAGQFIGFDVSIDDYDKDVDNVEDRLNCVNLFGAEAYWSDVSVLGKMLLVD